MHVGGRAFGAVMGRFGHDAEQIADDVGTDAGAGGCGGLSFAPGTLVATPAGERPIASLTVGDQVTAYDPASHSASPQTVTTTFVNHDDNVVDVTLRVVASQAAASNTTAGKPANTAPSKNLPTTTKSQQTHDETVQTTTNHPWLTADRNWEPAGFLRVDEPVVQADGRTAVVIAVRAVSGTAAMWDLTVANVHTFAVGDGQFVVHNSNCGRFDGDKPGYKINDAHDPKSPNYNPRKTPLPDDAEEVYKHAVPGDPRDPNAWYGKNANGDVYRYQGDKYSSMGPDQRPTYHFNASTGSRPRIGGGPLRWNDIPDYALRRLGLR